jgi:hypothetical protein
VNCIGLWSLVFGLWSLVWPLVFGLWPLVFVVSVSFVWYGMVRFGRKLTPKNSMLRPKTKSQRPIAAQKSGHRWPLSFNLFFRWSLNYHYAFFLVKLLEHHLNYLALFSRYQFADVVCLDGELTMLLATID